LWFLILGFIPALYRHRQTTGACDEAGILGGKKHRGFADFLWLAHASE
jgi:hypothetical protein